MDKEQKELVDGFDRYYVIEFIRKKLRLYIPIRRSEEIGLRGVMTEAKLDGVLKTLRSLPQKLPKHFRSRKKEIEDRLQSGYPTKIASAVRELTWRKNERDLCRTDVELLSKARSRLSTELALAMDSEVDEAEEWIDAALAKAIEAKEQELQAA